MEGMREVVREEIMSVRKMKGSKVAGVDDAVIEMMKTGGISIIDWLLRIFYIYIYMESGVVLEYWEAACIILTYRGNGDRRDAQIIEG